MGMCYYKLMNVIMTLYSMYIPTVLCLKPDWQAVHTTGCLKEGKDPSGDTSPESAFQKNSNAITLLQEGISLTLAVLSSYGSIMSLVSSLCAKLICYQSDVLITFPWRSVMSCNIFAVGTRSGMNATGQFRKNVNQGVKISKWVWCILKYTILKLNKWRFIFRNF